MINFKDLTFNLVEVVVNNVCNLDCSYCFMENRKDGMNTMTTETLQNIFRFCRDAQIENPNEYISIIFTLKEPLMSWKMIREARETLEFDLQDYSIFMVINTNGTLITEDVLQYCQNHNIDLHISLDGPKDIHDRGRVYRGNKQGSSFDNVYELIQNHPNWPYMSYMTTIHLQDIERITEIFQFMSNLPISCWVYGLNKFDPWTPETIEQLENEIKKFIDSATPTQLKKCRFENTAASAPNLNVINGLKFVQNGDLFLQPPTPNDGAKEGEFLSRVYLGNVNSGNIILPDKYKQVDYSDYELVGNNCSSDCIQYGFCKRGTDKKIYVSDFSCLRFQHFLRMAQYAKGGTMTDSQYQELRNTMPIYNAVINVTDNCNLRCPYCFTECNKRVIDMGTMKAAIGFIINEIERIPGTEAKPGINFFGGEPMLHYDDIIVPTVEWAEESGIRDKYKMSFGMTTNGTLLTEERLQWLADHEVNILLSIDGDKETQDSQRPGPNGTSSFDILAPKLPLIIKYFPLVTFRSAIEPYNVDKMFDNYLFARSNNFINYFITPNVHADWSLENIEKAMEQLSLIGFTMYRDITNGIQPLVWNELLTAIKTCFFPHNDNEISFNHCGIGTNTMGVSANGDINGCQEHNTYVEHDIFHIGNIFTGIDSVKHRRLLAAFKEQKHPVCKEMPHLCDNCSFYNDCAHNYCPSHNLTRGVAAIENSLVTCMWKRFVKDLAYTILEQIVEDKNQVMIDFLEKITINQDGPDNYSVW